LGLSLNLSWHRARYTARLHRWITLQYETE
jgi:hypothetical protein